YGSVFHNLSLYGEAVYWLNITAILVSLFMALFIKSIFDISTTGKINQLFNTIIILSFADLLIALFIDLELAMKIVSVHPFIPTY
ncbi:MAG: histidine kinase, partial [Methylococcales bacterium]|nr:histidine kinase [Methylococcales bacterium]